MIYTPAKYEVATFNSLEHMHLQENTLFDLDLGTKVIKIVVEYVTYAPTKLKVSTSNCLGENTITRTMTDRQTYMQYIYLTL